MRIALPIHRKNYYRLLGPVVEEALRRGHRVECWHDWAHPRRGGKSAEFPDAVPPALAHDARIRAFNGVGDLARQWWSDPPDVVISLDPPPPDVRGTVPTRWLWLQHSTDILFYPTPEGVLASDGLATYSSYWTAKLGERFAGLASADELRRRASAVGMPELDAFSTVDPAEVRRRLGLPSDRPIVLYLPFPLRSNPPTFWLRRVFTPSTRLGQGLATLVARRKEYWEDVRRGWNDRRLVESVRTFCDRAGAVLVMKSRLKDPIPRYARRLADLALYDPSYYPPTILELLSVASLCIHAYSTAVFEAAHCGVPSLCLAPDRRDTGLPDFVHDFVHNGALGGIYNWPGTAYCVPLRDAFNGLRRWGLDDFPLAGAARKRYVERFLGFDDGRSAGRLLDVAASLVQRPRTKWPA
jgi:hypothetical protein